MRIKFLAGVAALIGTLGLTACGTHHHHAAVVVHPAPRLRVQVPVGRPLSRVRPVRPMRPVVPAPRRRVCTSGGRKYYC